MKGTISFSFLFTSLLSLTIAQIQVPDPTPVTVAAPAGTIIGQTGRLNSSVHEFLGIPFAKPPTGTLRFEPPVRKPPARSPVSARKFGLSCPQFYPPGLSAEGFNTTSNVTVSEGEDCLSLNIWTRPGFEKAPVLVYIYGGGFILGFSDIILYDGTDFAAHNDVVVVSINYRVNVFGFPNSPDIATQNVGFLDQRMAVEWVRDNIAAFGGNPNQITIFGESAGGVSVDVWSYAWPKDPIVKGFIAQSGTVGLLPWVSSQGSYDSWKNLIVAAGCAFGTAAQQLKCMKNLDWKILRAALTPVYNTAAHCRVNIFNAVPEFFLPRVDGKTVFSPEEYKRKGEKGEFARLPLLIGSTDKEVLPSMINIPSNASCSNIRGLILDIPLTINPDIYAKIVTASVFTCPARMQARYRTLHHVPVWRYRFFDSLNFTTSALNTNATHGSELKVLFGLAALVEQLHPREAKILREMQSAWATFAKNPAQGLNEDPFRWNRYTLNPFDKNLVRLAYGQEWKASMSRDLMYDYFCDILEAGVNVFK